MYDVLWFWACVVASFRWKQGRNSGPGVSVKKLLIFEATHKCFSEEFSGEILAFWVIWNLTEFEGELIGSTSRLAPIVQAAEMMLVSSIKIWRGFSIYEATFSQLEGRWMFLALMRVLWMRIYLFYAISTEQYIERHRRRHSSIGTVTFCYWVILE